jgi:hypothetical protein
VDGGGVKGADWTKGTEWMGRYALAVHNARKHGGGGGPLPRAPSPSTQQRGGQRRGIRVPIVEVVGVGREMRRWHFYVAAGARDLRVFRVHGLQSRILPIPPNTGIS